VAFELPTTSEAVHAGGDDRSPLRGFLVYPHPFTLHKLSQLITHICYDLQFFGQGRGFCEKINLKQLISNWYQNDFEYPTIG